MARRIHIYFIIFLAVALLIFSIGIASEVSLKASVSRALLAAAVFTALCLIAFETVIRCGLQGQQGSGEMDHPAAGRNLDITVSETTNETAYLHDPPNDAQRETPSETQSGFVPLSAKQIDPQISKVINADPGKMADIIRKMGFEQS